MEINTGIQEIDQLLNESRWSKESTDAYANNLKKAFKQKPEINYEKFVVAFNDLKFDKNEYGHTRIWQPIFNGWPEDPEQVDKFIQEHWDVNNNCMIGDVKSYDEYIKFNSSCQQADFIICPNSPCKEYDDLKTDFSIYKKLSDIEPGTKYLYPIKLLGTGHLHIASAKERGVYLPDRVVQDIKNGLCKILVHEELEGHGRNMSEVKTFFETMSKFYNIPMSSLSFLDSNYLTPCLQESYGTKGFYYPHWEWHISSTYENNIDFCCQVHDRLRMQRKQMISCKYRFVNLNRRIRSHRSQATLYNYLKHNDKIFWSYLISEVEACVRLDNLKDSLRQFKNKKIEKYVSLLPKIIDVKGEVNDVQVNSIQFNGNINLVSETMFYEYDTLFFSEKIYKPLYSGQPFVLIGNPGSLEVLRNQGYETFSPWIDETYDTIIDPAERMACIFKEIDRICNMSQSSFNNMMCGLTDICYRNHIHHLTRRKTLSPLKEVLVEISDWVNN